MNTSDILNRAADLIQQRGWSTGCGWDDPALEGAPLCLEGGIQAAMGISLDDIGEPLESCPGYVAVSDYLNRARGAALYRWNDADGRTAAQVVEVLRACAVIEASRERKTAAVS